MKKISAITFSFLTFLSLAPSSFAAVGGDIVNLCPDDFAGLCDISDGGISGLITGIINLLFVVAVLLALGFLIYGGIRWIMSGGDKSKVEAARGMIVASLVGLVLVFLSYFIINLVFNFFFGTNLGNLRLPTLQPGS